MKPMETRQENQIQTRVVPLYSRVNIPTGAGGPKEIVFFKQTRDEGDGEHDTNMVSSRELQDQERYVATHMGFVFPNGILLEDWNIFSSKKPIVRYTTNDRQEGTPIPFDYFRPMMSIGGGATEKVTFEGGNLTAIPEKFVIEQRTKFKVSIEFVDDDWTGLSAGGLDITCYLSGAGDFKGGI